jgi:hypothetical protein
MAIISNPVEVRAENRYKIRVLFSDGISGEIDLSELAGKGIFNKWNTVSPFEQVYIDPVSHAIAWDDELEIDSDTLYLQLIGKTFDQWQREHQPAYAAN